MNAMLVKCASVPYQVRSTPVVPSARIPWGVLNARVEAVTNLGVEQFVMVRKCLELAVDTLNEKIKSFLLSQLSELHRALWSYNSSNFTISHFRSYKYPAKYPVLIS